MAIKKLSRTCKGTLFISCLCLDSKHISDSLAEQIEPKDLIYRNKKKLVGITGQKLESSYYSGSSAETEVVEIPSVETLRLNLHINGFENIQTIITPAQFDEAMQRNTRPTYEVCIVARRAKTCSSDLETVIDYELNALQTVLAEEIFGKIQVLINQFTHPDLTEILQGVPSSTHEIIQNIPKAPTDKLKFELSKIILQKGKVREGLEILEDITSSLNADWRTCYRSFFMLSVFDNPKKSYYLDLLKSCNPRFPETLIKKLNKVNFFSYF